MQYDFITFRSNTTDIVTNINEFALNAQLEAINYMQFNGNETEQFILESTGNEQCLLDLRYKLNESMRIGGIDISSTSSFAYQRLNNYVFIIFDNLRTAQIEANTLPTLVSSYLTDWNPLFNTIQEFYNSVESSINQKAIQYNYRRATIEFAVNDFDNDVENTNREVRDYIYIILNTFKESITTIQNELIDC